MKPVLTATEMAEVDRRAQASVPMETLIERAGTAVARHAVAMLGGAYGRYVLVVAGKGHNGDDGRVAARLLSRRGASVRVVAPDDLVSSGAPVDLVVDAAYGTGFHGEYAAPALPPHAAVLAIDLPSGLDADLGAASEGVVAADVTVTFGAYKPGLLLGRGPELVGSLALEPIGLPVEGANLHLVEDDDVVLLAPRTRDAHKWRSAVFVLAGSPGMRGAAALSCAGAFRTGAGMVRTGSPGVDPGSSLIEEVVAIGLDADDFAATVVVELRRCRALVAGPGLGTGDAVRAALLQILEQSEVPAVLDADALTVLAATGSIAEVLSSHRGPVVLTPHDGEFERLAGSPPGADRLGAARSLAALSGATVLLKGATTIVAAPDGRALLAAAGSPRLATAGSGDVLSGVIGALLARGVPPLEAAGLGAHLHGRAAGRGLADGLMASDLPRLVAEELSDLAAHVGTTA